MKKIFQIARLEFATNEHDLHQPIAKYRKRHLANLWNKIINFYRNLHPSSSRLISITDSMCIDAIYLLFPVNVDHYNENGKQEEVSLFSYFDEHFVTANHELTPRIFVIYIMKIISNARAYYSSNPDQNKRTISRDNKYHLFMKGHLTKAYGDLQRVMLLVFADSVQYNDKWKKMLNKLLLNKGRKYVFSYDALANIFDEKNTDEMRALLGYLCHLGVIMCRDNSINITRRYYELPLLLRYIWSKE